MAEEDKAGKPPKDKGAGGDKPAKAPKGDGERGARPDKAAADKAGKGGPKGGKGAQARDGRGAPKGEKSAAPAPRPKDYRPRMKALYDSVVREAMKKEFGYQNLMQIPRIEKVVLNMG